MFQFPQPLWKRLRSWSNIFNQKMESPFARNRNLAGWVPAVGIPRDLSMVTGLVSHFSYMLKRSCNKTERGMSHLCQALTIFVPKHEGIECTQTLPILLFSTNLSFELGGIRDCWVRHAKIFAKNLRNRSNIVSYHVTFANRNSQRYSDQSFWSDLMASTPSDPISTSLTHEWIFLGPPTHPSFRKKYLIDPNWLSPQWITIFKKNS